MGRLVLILGGARSGKSAMAERMARRTPGAGSPSSPRPRPWTTRWGSASRPTRPRGPRGGAPWRSRWSWPRAVETAVRESDLVLVDCLTLWVSNQLCRLPADEVRADVTESDLAALEEELRAQVARVARAAREGGATLLVVSNEVGMGLVPANPLGRSYRDLLGLVNRWVAAEADQLLLMVAGVPLDLKKLAAEEWL